MVVEPAEGGLSGRRQSYWVEAYKDTEGSNTDVQVESMDVFVRSIGPLGRVGVVLLSVEVWKNSTHRRE